MSHSHPATKQDEWVLDKIGSAGIFSEVGAFDGITHSNTLLLEQEGWVGTLIEGHKTYANMCRLNRPYCETHHALIGSGGLEVFAVGGQWSGIVDHMAKEFADEHKRRSNHAYLLQSKPLADVIGTPILDYLSIDTEGGEFWILKDWFEAGGRTRSLTVEFRYEQAELARLEWLLTDYGMFLDEVRGFDLCFLEERNADY